MNEPATQLPDITDAIAEPLLEQPPAEPQPSIKPAHVPHINSSNAVMLAKKSWDARRARAALPKPDLSILPEPKQEIADVPAIALQSSQAHSGELPAQSGLPHQKRRSAELNAQIDAINALMDKATKGQLVVGYEEDGLIFASPRDIQALSKAKRDAMEMLFRIFAVAREPIAKTPSGHQGRRQDRVVEPS